MRKICLIAVAVLVVASSAAHAELARGLTVASADPVPQTQSAPVVAQAAPAAPAAAQPAPATTILQTTNPQAQMVLQQLQAHGLVQTPPTTQPAPAISANIVTLPAQGQPAQVQTVQTPVAQSQAVATQPVAMVSQPPVSQQQVNQVSQPVTAPVTPSVTSAKPVVHTTSHHETDEAKARRIAARYGIHW
jgi:hypothetical protein